MVSQSRHSVFLASNDKMNGSAHQTTPEYSLPVTWVSPDDMNLQCGLVRQHHPEFGLAVTGSSMPQWLQLTQRTPPILLSSLSDPVSKSKPKSGSLSREVAVRQARLRAQQMREFKRQNPKATQSEIASPSCLEYSSEGPSNTTDHVAGRHECSRA